MTVAHWLLYQRPWTQSRPGYDHTTRNRRKQEVLKERRQWAGVENRVVQFDTTFREL
jgi:hypothetical protein